MEERNLCPVKGLRLECLKPKCFNCPVAADCKIYIKKHKCDLYKTLKQYNSTVICTKNRKCDTCALREKKYQCMTKKYYSVCSVKKGKYMDCKDLPPKCINNSNYFIY